MFTDGSAAPFRINLLPRFATLDIEFNSGLDAYVIEDAGLEGEVLEPEGT